MKYHLGLDLGVRSLGWAVVGIDPLHPKVIDAGVRCFEAGVEGDIEKGKDASRSRERRQKRGARRQLRRRSARLTKLLRALQRLGFVGNHCSDTVDTPESRHALLDRLDAELRAKLLPQADHQGEQVFLYQLRARAALGEELPPFAVGRALYHLAQRRGLLYLSSDSLQTPAGD